MAQFLASHATYEHQAAWNFKVSVTLILLEFPDTPNTVTVSYASIRLLALLANIRKI